MVGLRAWTVQMETALGNTDQIDRLPEYLEALKCPQEVTREGLRIGRIPLSIVHITLMFQDRLMRWPLWSGIIIVNKEKNQE